MNYQGYTKIPLSSSDWKNFNGKIKKWYVTEKVHGSCFCFIYDVTTKKITCAKRKEVIKDDEKFYGFRNILPELCPKIEVISNLLLKNTKNINVSLVHVYGELFGGIYPNIKSKYKPVQNGIYYSPNLHFYAFDISYIDTSLKEQYVDFEDALEIFKLSQILYAEPIIEFTTLECAVNYPIGFDSTLPQKLGLPIITPNKAEGIVIRSSVGRWLVKRKIPEFDESKYGYANYDDFDTNLPILDQYKNKAICLITTNRLNNAISKYGEFEQYRSEILDEFVNDIMFELNGYHIFGLKDWLDDEIKKFVY